MDLTNNRTYEIKKNIHAKYWHQPWNMNYLEVGRLNSRI